MVTNMDADDPEQYCKKLCEIDAQQLELNKIIQTLKAELAGMQKELCNVDLPVVDNYTYNPPDTGMQREMCNVPSSYIGELGEELASPEVDYCHRREQSLERNNPIDKNGAYVHLEKYNGAYLHLEK